MLFLLTLIFLPCWDILKTPSFLSCWNFVFPIPSSSRAAVGVSQSSAEFFFNSFSASASTSDLSDPTRSLRSWLYALESMMITSDFIALRLKCKFNDYTCGLKELVCESGSDRTLNLEGLNFFLVQIMRLIPHRYFFPLLNKWN